MANKKYKLVIVVHSLVSVEEAQDCVEAIRLRLEKLKDPNVKSIRIIEQSDPEIEETALENVEIDPVGDN